MTATDLPILRLGIIADPQYAPVPPNPVHDRFYAKSLAKIAEAMDVFEREALDAVVVLGDLIDHGIDNLAPVLKALARSRHELILLPGNHDFAVAEEHLATIHRRLGMPAPYHHLLRKGVRLIVLDGNEISTFAPPPGDPRRAQAKAKLATLTASGVPNAMAWNAGISETQFSWLERQLAQAAERGERAIVLGHYPLHPFTDHSLWDAPRVAKLIADAPAAIAYFCGHYHAGNYGLLGHTHFVNFKGMVDTEAHNAFAIAELYQDRLDIRGFGREESRRLSLSSPAPAEQ
ncbi:metallophosphoesterase [Rhizobium sp. RU36D]|uniref:metallophosphoesterase n=1 Tax=Rhizobium sp. RU36D TaxID=1907415 RepID=UPI0009D83DC2|nr:metallophosphoesterase [Rhizobium sp. RU36D]SMD19117.1 Calcineurin-like phosphoesterase [Rhizobium sp. RU36D]